MQSCVAHYPHPLRYNLCVPKRVSLIARFSLTTGPSGADRTQVGPILLYLGCLLRWTSCDVKIYLSTLGGPLMTSVVDSHYTNSMVVNNGQQRGHLTIQISLELIRWCVGDRSDILIDRHGRCYAPIVGHITFLWNIGKVMCPIMGT